jgi:superfamily II DNA or RNA helicase
VDLQPVTVAMVQTAGRLPHQLFSDYGLAIGDEAHHVPAEIFYEVFSELQCEYVIGLSATPRREDGKEMLIWAGTGPICANISASDLIERGFLARPHIDFLEIDPVPVPRHTNYQEVYKRAIVENEDRNTQIALKAVELAEKGKIYIHVRRVAHGERLAALVNELLPQGYHKAEFIYGQDTTQTRQRVINSFRKKDLRVLVSTLLGEGMDLPEMYALILASGGLSRTFVQQVFGRVLRGALHKDVEVWDIRDLTVYLYEHFLERVRFYKSEPAFVLSPKLEKIEPPAKEE